MKIKFGIFFFLLGLTISAIFGAIVGNKIPYIVVVALISGVGLAIVSIVIYKVLETKVPEFVDFLENFSYSTVAEEDTTETEASNAGVSASENIEDYVARQNAAQSHNEATTLKSTDTKQKEKSSPGVLTIDNITIKNEPKLMAEAIRTMLATDESPTSATPRK